MEIRSRWMKATGAAVMVAGVLAIANDRTDAATATANLAVSATVINNCTISTAALAFGNYDPVVANASTGLSGTGTVTVACTKGAVTTITLGLGANPTGSQRRLTDGTNFLNYEIYKEVAHTNVWGTSAATDVDYTASSKAASAFTAFGLVAANQDVPAGSYTDTVVATVNF